MFILLFMSLHGLISDYSVEHTSDVYSDVALSDGAESLMNKWKPPTVVSASS